MPKLKHKRRKRIFRKAREPETRENYHKWPTTSILVTGLACGSIFFIASNPRGINTTPDLKSFILQSLFMSLSVVTFFPSLFILFILICYWIMKALRIRIPRWVFRNCPLIKEFHRTAMRESNEDSFLVRENQRREFIGDTMLQLQSSDESSYDSENSYAESTTSEIWTTYNHHHSDPVYQCDAGISPSCPDSSLTSVDGEQEEQAASCRECVEFPAVYLSDGDRYIYSIPPQIIVNSPSPPQR